MMTRDDSRWLKMTQDDSRWRGGCTASFGPAVTERLKGTSSSASGAALASLAPGTGPAWHRAQSISALHLKHGQCMGNTSKYTLYQYIYIYIMYIIVSHIYIYIYVYIYINFYHHNFMNVAYVMHCGVTIVSKQTYVRRGAPTCYNTLISCHGPIVLNIAFHGPHGIPSGIPDPLIPLGVHSLARWGSRPTQLWIAFRSKCSGSGAKRRKMLGYVRYVRTGMDSG